MIGCRTLIGGAVITSRQHCLSEAGFAEAVAVAAVPPEHRLPLQGSTSAVRP